MKISFDFDCTLGETQIKKLAAIIIAASASDVCIITSRCSGKSHNRDLCC